MLTNSQGFKRFFELYFEPVYRFVRKYTEEDAIARDITQDTFIRLYERRRDFDVPEKAKSFIYITARNLCLDHLKHQKNKTTIPTDTIGIRGQRPGFFYMKSPIRKLCGFSIKLSILFPLKPEKSFYWV